MRVQQDKRLMGARTDIYYFEQKQILRLILNRRQKRGFVTLAIKNLISSVTFMQMPNLSSSYFAISFKSLS